jgi:type IV secretory pathway VirB3-like protein
MDRRADEELEVISVALADTRPAFKWGVTYNMAVALVTVFAIITCLVQSPTFVALGLAGEAAVFVTLHTILKRDHNAPRIGLVWGYSKALTFDDHLWGGASLDPNKWPREHGLE